jgi:two-component SAPR family response regulator
MDTLLSTVIINEDKEYGERLAEMFRTNPYVSVNEIFESAELASVYLTMNRADIVVIDTGITCVDLEKVAERLRKGNLRTVIVFTEACDTEASEASLEKFNERKSEFIGKGLCDFFIGRPAALVEVHEIVIRALLMHDKRSTSPVIIRTFGSFAVLHEDKAIHFSNSKAKELLALCIDRMGSEMSMEEVIDVLWPDRPYDDNVKRLYRKAISNLRKSLNDAVGETLFKTSRGFCSLDVSKISCDYFMFMKEYSREKVDASVMDYYLPEYTWSEFTIAKLFFDSMKRKERKNLGDNE